MSKISRKIILCIFSMSSFFALFSNHSLNSVYAEGDENVKQYSASEGNLLLIPPLLEEQQEFSVNATIKTGNVITELLLWFAESAVNGMKRSYNTVFVDEVYKYAEDIDERMQYKYYIVNFDPNKNLRLYSSTVLTFDEAKAYVFEMAKKAQEKPGQFKKANIWTPNQVSALELARALSLNKPAGPENEALRNPYNKSSTDRYYWHYHDGSSKAEHIFYGIRYETGKANPSFVQPALPTEEEAY
ncbi:hypothetical protein B9G55_08490 [Saccharibacillus sp. O16]|nr:hypothetical protein B9G55_08490 [Saccharibacillus sp. O16]